MPRRACSLFATALLCVAVTACGSPQENEKVILGGTTVTGKLDRPWGQVSAAPLPVRAEEPVDADLAFARDMVHHHQQAIELSTNLLIHADADERIRAAARFIKTDQESEIANMTAWADAWAAEGFDLAHNHGDQHHHATEMPGMVAQDRVDAVADMKTASAQIEYFVLMIEHHRGAVKMSQDYLEPSVNSFTINTAKHIIREQETEIKYMTRVIDELCATTPVPTCPAQ